jgi:histidinol-phosphatase (PHP family)
MSSAGTEPAAHPAGGPGLPADDHVHTEFSWDAANRGSMDASCEQAIELGLPSIAFTEHVDPTPWVVPDHATAMFGDDIAAHIGDDLRLRAPAVDFEGYFASIERCRVRYPSLRIVTGLEIGEPHWHPQTTRALLGSGRFERVLGSLHSLTIASEPRLIDEWFRTEHISGAEEAAAVRDYLGEAITMIESDDQFEVFAHIDYLVRQIEAAGRAHDPRHFEAEYRETLGALARSGRVLEVNTRIPLDPVVVGWWYEVGGRAVSFGSDAHTPGAVGHGFAEAAAVAEAVGFGPAADPRDFWRRGSPVA